MYHVTDHERALAIEREGFRDGSATLIAGRSRAGVWLCNEPLLELYPVVLVIEVDPETIVQYECTNPDQGFRQWLVPAEIVNRARWQRISV